MRSIVRKIKKFFKHPLGSLIVVFGYENFKFLSDKTYLKIMFKYFFDKNLDFATPKTFNEKLQWLKINNRCPEYSTWVDKVEVRDYISQKIGEEYLIPCLGVWNDVDSIDFDKLPNQFVLKCNHNSGKGMCICKDKSKLNIKEAKSKLKKGLRENYFYSGREWPYKNVTKRIIAEEYMGEALNDYKFQCFNGNIDNVLVCRNRFSANGVEYYYFDANWNYLPYSKQFDESFNDFDSLKPTSFDLMKEIVQKLSYGIPEVRVDLYDLNGKVYFGELTFFTQSGFDTTITELADIEMGKHLILPIV